jgi:signal transduction histidine kinase
MNLQNWLGLHNRLRDPSLHFLLAIEWILLGLTALSEFNQRYQLFDERSPLLSIVCIILLALLGLCLPSQLPAKIGYAAIHLFLVFLAAVVGHIDYFFLLCVVLVMRSYLLFERQGRQLTLAVMSGLFISLQMYRVQAFSQRALTSRLRADPEDAVRPFFFGSILLFFLVLIFLHLMMKALLAAHASQTQLTQANAQLRHYALQVEEIATLQERTRIAREIHDSLGHSLIALNLSLSAAIGLWEQDLAESKSLLSEAQLLSQGVLKDVRQAVAALRSEPLAGQSLAALVQGLIAQLQQTSSTQFSCRLQLSGPLAEVQKVAAYRIVQEALTNITKHAQATKVEVSLETKEGRLAIAIRDNGQGFDRAQTASGFGLRGMEERVLALGGTLSIVSVPRKGCDVVAQLPMQVIR